MLGQTDIISSQWTRVAAVHFLFVYKYYTAPYDIRPLSNQANMFVPVKFSKRHKADMPPMSIAKFPAHVVLQALNRKSLFQTARNTSPIPR